jgi:hypothetical protein
VTTGLDTPMHTISPNSTAMHSPSPATPGPMNASPTGQQDRSVPAVSMTRRCPNRLTSRGDSREPIRPPVHGTANARLYCHGANFSVPSIRTASSGSVAMTSPLKVSRLRNSSRSSRCQRMYRHPSIRSPSRNRAAEASAGRDGRASPPPIIRMPAADSR